MSGKEKARRVGKDPVVVLAEVFAVLKVLGVISWSWLWVLSPIWLTCLFFGTILGGILVAGRILTGRWA